MSDRLDNRVASAFGYVPATHSRKMSRLDKFVCGCVFGAVVIVILATLAIFVGGAVWVWSHV